MENFNTDIDNHLSSTSYSTLKEYIYYNPTVSPIRLLIGAGQALERLHSRSKATVQLKASSFRVEMRGNEFPAEISLNPLVEAEAFTTARIAGSPRWTAPEILDMYDENEPFPSPEADVFAFGRVIFEVLTKKTPFFNIQNDATVALQVMKGINPRCPDDMPLSKEIRELLSRCWNSDPRKRPTAHQIVTALTRLWALEV